LTRPRVPGGEQSQTESPLPAVGTGVSRSGGGWEQKLEGRGLGLQRASEGGALLFRQGGAQRLEYLRDT